jgi:hypothetical protein
MRRPGSVLVVVMSSCLLVSGAALADEAPSVNAAPPPAPAGADPAAPVPGPAGVAPAPPQPPPPAAYPGYTPSVQYADRDRRPPRQRRKIGLMIAGLGVFAAGYVGAVVSIAFSSALYGEDSAVGPELAVPIAGPWLGLASTNWEAVPDSQRVSAQATMVLQGGLQAVGAILATIGISKYIASGQPASGDGARRVSFQLSPTAGGAFGMVSGRF